MKDSAALFPAPLPTRRLRSPAPFGLRRIRQGRLSSLALEQLECFFAKLLERLQGPLRRLYLLQQLLLASWLGSDQNVTHVRLSWLPSLVVPSHSTSTPVPSLSLSCQKSVPLPKPPSVEQHGVQAPSLIISRSMSVLMQSASRLIHPMSVGDERKQACVGVTFLIEQPSEVSAMVLHGHHGPNGCEKPQPLDARSFLLHTPISQALHAPSILLWPIESARKFGYP